jgi:hypothetical protein
MWRSVCRQQYPWELPTPFDRSSRVQVLVQVRLLVWVVLVSQGSADRVVIHRVPVWQPPATASAQPGSSNSNAGSVCTVCAGRAALLFRAGCRC